MYTPKKNEVEAELLGLGNLEHMFGPVEPCSQSGPVIIGQNGYTDRSINIDGAGHFQIVGLCT